MARPHQDNSLTLDNVLSRMVPGKTYAAHIVAAKFHVPTSKIRPLLQQLLERGDVELSRSLPKALGFKRPRGADVEAEQPFQVETSIATQPVHIRLDGQLTGYGSEIAQRIALCMLVRGAR